MVEWLEENGAGGGGGGSQQENGSAELAAGGVLAIGGKSYRECKNAPFSPDTCPPPLPARSSTPLF